MRIKVFRRTAKRVVVSARQGPDFLPGDLVHITLPENDPCRRRGYSDRHGVITYGPDNESGWLVETAVGGLRCVASELTMLTPREERY